MPERTMQMKKADGTSDSIVHFPDATTAIPDAKGVVQVPGRYVVSMLGAGYVAATPAPQ